MRFRVDLEATLHKVEDGGRVVSSTEVHVDEPVTEGQATPARGATPLSKSRPTGNNVASYSHGKSGKHTRIKLPELKPVREDEAPSPRTPSPNAVAQTEPPPKKKTHDVRHLV